MRTRFVILLVTMLLALAACQAGGGDDGGDGGDGDGGAEGSPAATGAEDGAEDGGAAGEGTEIDEESISGEVRLSGGRSSDAEETLLEETLAAFGEKYPDITVNYEPIPEAYAETMIGQFSTGDPPDLFYVGATGEAAPWIEDELLLPLDDYIAGNPEIGIEAFYPDLLAPFQRDGSTYGLPKDASPLALFYNPDMLDEAGVEPPTSWDELAAAAEALTSGDVTGFCLGAEMPRWGAFIYQNGGAIRRRSAPPGAARHSAPARRR
jgi:multiple sugar transport system substrate-binding protein